MNYAHLNKLAAEYQNPNGAREIYEALITLASKGLLPAALTAGIGAHAGGALGLLTSPKGYKTEGLGRGVVRGAGTGLGASAGLTAATMANELGDIENPLARLAVLGLGGVGGGLGGDYLAKKLID